VRIPHKHIIFLFVILFSLELLGCSNSDTKEPSRLDAYVISQQFVQQKLKAPSSADFPVFDENMVITNDDKRFKVESYVDAQNSFGATVRTRYVCIVTHIEKDKWELNTIQLLD
jgi:hypothetical protein